MLIMLRVIMLRVLVRTLVSSFKTPRELENLALRHQLLLLQRPSLPPPGEGEEAHQVADLDRVVEVDAVDRRGHDACATEAIGARAGSLVDELHDGAAVDLAHEVGVDRLHLVGEHQAGLATAREWLGHEVEAAG